jgi:group I intron endonuclease
MQKCGIYQIVSCATGKLYVGSSKSIGRRWTEHRRQLKAKVHPSPRLQRAWDKHGESNFVFSVLEECVPEVLFEREQFHIDRLKPDYNSMLRVRVISKEMRAKMNAAMVALAALITHCPKGHAYDERNTYLSKRNGARVCRTCNRERVAAIYEAETPEQTAVRNAKSNANYYAKHEVKRALQNEYAASHREEKRAYDMTYRPIKNERRRVRATA